MRQTESMLSVKGIYKSFGSNEVLKGISLDIRIGEVLALIGGNGAGKSTLMKIIMGIHQQDRGEIFIAGKELLANKPSVALSQGVYLVPQEPMLFPNMSVLENIIIGFEQKQTVLEKQLKELIEELGWKMDLDRKASSLSIAEQQLVEILRGLLRKARVLILDEPTSALTFDEVESLFKVVEKLKKQGISIIYITHRLTEVFQIATHVAIMRDGVVTLDGPVQNFTREDLVKGLLPTDCVVRESKGKNVKLNYSKAKPVFELKDYSGYGFSQINLEVYPGEILGLAGVVGAGRTELAATIFGKDTVKGGKAILDGSDITGLSTREVIDKGLNYVPEDRHLNGLFKISDITANITSARLRTLSKFFLNKKEEQKITANYVKDFRIKVTDHEQLAGSLSGGNQQKLVIARALSTNPKLVILDEPTRGIDAAARCDVYSIIHQLKDLGVAVLLISSDMEEIVELSDRAVSMYQGRINQTFTKEEINEDNLMAASFGVVRGGLK